MTTHAIECPKCRTLVLFEIPADPQDWQLITCPVCESLMDLVERAPFGTYHAKAERIA